MKILHLSTNDTRGGAARAAYRLHCGLFGQGYDSFMFVAHCGSGDRSVTAFSPPMDLRSRLRRVLQRELIWRDFVRYQSSRPPGYDYFTDDRSEHGAALVGQLPVCEVINLHWIAGFIDYRFFFSRVPNHIPIVWTFHDMNPFTGGCHYDEGCGRFVECCGGCPQLDSKDLHDLSGQIWRRKRKIFQQIEPDRLHIVTPSLWLAEEAKRSSLLGRFSSSVIPNGLDTDIFSPRDPSIARAVLELPQSARVVLFVAGSTENWRKGFVFLVEALSALTELPNLFLVSLGGGKPALNSHIDHLHLGYAENDRLLSFAYSAADVFVISSLQDNFPNTVLEALACGTPVVGFSVGGIPEMVRSGVTGLLAPPGDERALAGAITYLLENEATRAEMSANCRRIATEEYSLQIQAKRYIKLYETLVNGQ
jgi:glycosyltransferase involved in cell wall biosynthesis